MHRPIRTFLPAALSLASAFPATSHAQHWFDAVAQYPQLVESPLRAAHDLDGDARVEFVSRKGASWRVWKSSGQGDLALAAQSPVPQPSSSIDTPLIGDFDGDQVADLVYAELASGVPNALRLQHGLGLTFDGGDTIGLPLAPRRVAAGDFDADGVLDAAVLCAAGGQAVLGWYTRGPGGWIAHELDADALSGSFALATLDFDHDGDSEIAAAVGNLVHVFTSAGGVPQYATTLALPAALGGVFGPSLLVADFDADGDDDLLAYAQGLGTSKVAYAEQLAPGNFAVGAASTVSAALGIASAGDWDADGDLDVCAGLQVVRNDDGVFETAFAAGQAGASTLGLGPGMSDLDGDGRMDAVAESSVYFGDGTFTLQPPVPGPLSLHTLLTDWEGDGDLDGVNLDDLSLRLSNGAQYTQQALALPSLPQFEYYRTASGFADFDGDGARDFVVGHVQIVHPFVPATFLGTRLLRGDGLGHFSDVGLATAQPIGLPFGTQKGQLVLDAEGDGDLDVLATSGFFYNDGSGHFPSSDSFGSPQSVHDGADFDLDGDIDLVGWGPITLDVALRTQISVGNYTTQIVASGPWPGTVYLSAHDLDDDGDADIAALESGGSQRVFPLENSGGAFSVRPPTDTGLIGLVYPFDADLDGRTDLAAVPFNSVTAGTLVVWRRSSSALTYEPARKWTGPGILTGDVDQDGDVDFVAGSITRNRAADAAAAGALEQYGTPTAGTLGVAPVLGYRGPMQIGATVELRLRHVSANGPAILGYSTGSAALAGLPFASTTLAIDPFGLYPLLVIPLQPTGGISKGFTLSIPLDAGVAGLHVFKQAFVFDIGAPDLFSASNGLDVQYGI